MPKKKFVQILIMLRLIHAAHSDIIKVCVDSLKFFVSYNLINYSLKSGNTIFDTKWYSGKLVKAPRSLKGSELFLLFGQRNLMARIEDFLQGSFRNLQETNSNSLWHCNIPGVAFSRVIGNTMFRLK